MPYVFNFLGKENKHTHYGHLCVFKCPCMDCNKKTHKLWSFVSKCPCMDCSFLQNTTSVAIFWYSWHFCGYFLYLQPHKTNSHTGKKTPKFMDKSSHKTPFCGSARSSIEQVPYCFSRSYVKFQGHTALKIVDLDPNWAFPDCTSSLNSPMATKWCIELEVS